MLRQILGLIAIIGAVIYFQSKKNKKMKVTLINYFTSKGYSVMDYQNLTVENRSTGITFYVSTFSRRSGNTSRTYYRIEAIIQLFQPLIFTITSRGFFSKAFGINEGTLTQFEDLNISTPNPYQLQIILSDQDLNSRMRFFKSVIKKLEAMPMGDYTSIIAELDYNIRSAQFTVELIEQIVSIVNIEGDFVRSDDKIEDYRCFNCNASISFFGDYCRECGALAPKCVICYDDPEPNDLVIMFNCCKSYAHQDHALTWIEKEDRCPYCKQYEPELITVMDQ